MTSRPSLPRRSSGSRAAPATVLALALGRARFVGVALAAFALSTFSAVSPHAATALPSPLLETRDGVEIDWAAGTVTVGGGAAADLHMPSADVARLGAVRRAEAAARARLGHVLAALPLGAGRTLSGADVARAVARARLTSTEYQSNGGALVRVTARFGDWNDRAAAASPVAVLSVAAMHLGAAPLASHDVALGAAVYHLGAAPRDADARAAKVDHEGRLVLERAPGAALAEKLAKGTTLIYVGKVLR
jgi:hypothetical protein